MLPISQLRQSDLNASANQFNDLVIPILSKMLGDGEFYQIENSESTILELIDIYSGIDILFKNKNGILTLSSRIRNGTNWENFQIRYSRDTNSKTEYIKIKTAIENNLLYPEYKIQTFIKQNIVESVALIRTRELWEVVGGWIVENGLESNGAYPINSKYFYNGDFISIKYGYLKMIGSPSLRIWSKDDA
jgi:hypothetical protein